jgi:ketosteroid isomerase-like protein
MRSRQRTAQGQTNQQAADALRAADAAWLKAYQAKDVEKSAAFFGSKGSMLVPNNPILTGRDAVAKFIARSFTAPDYTIAWRPNQADVARSGELGYTSGTYELSFKDASGKAVADRGKYLMVWKKRADGTWSVLFDISNSDLPRASPL